MKNRNITPYYTPKVVENIVSLRQKKFWNYEYNIEIWPFGEVFAYDFCDAFRAYVVYLCGEEYASGNGA